MKILLKNSFLLISVFLLVYPVQVLSQDMEMEIRKGCIKATMKAIEMELRSYGEKLKTAESGVGPEGNIEKFKKRITELKTELERFSNMKPEEYIVSKEDKNGDLDFKKLKKFGPVMPPVKKNVFISSDQACKNGVILNVKDMTRSGPFYHISGILNNDYSRIKPGKTYNLTIYLVYKREYFGFIPDYYVYISDVQGK